MKLKQRIVLSVIGICIIVVILISHGVFLLENFTLESEEITDSRIPRDLQGIRGNFLKGKLTAAQKSMVAPFGHLNFPRKDLDASNNTSGHERAARGGDSGANSSLVRLLSGEETPPILRDRLLKDDFFKTRESIEKLLVAIDFIKKTSKSGGLSLDNLKNVLAPQNYENQRFLFQNAKSMDYRMQKVKDLEKKYQLNISEIDTLKNIKPTTRKKELQRTGRLLNLYDLRNESLTTWQRFHSKISQFELYQAGDPDIELLIRDMQTLSIVDTVMHDGGTQLKLILYLSNGARLMFKPMRFPRSQETLPNHFYFTDYERHTAEIAAFYLDRALGFRRVPPTAGRILDINRDIKRFANKHLLKTFFISPAGNICFHGACDYYCDTSHPICGNPDMIEGSVQQYLPASSRVRRKTSRNPWKRSYSKKKTATWEKNNKFCVDDVRNRTAFKNGRALLDITDLHVFDFLMGNLDRHHYETFYDFGNNTIMLHLDNGRGFGKPFHDEISILAPVYQCCLIRYSTLQKLLQFDQGPSKLSDIMRNSTSADLLAPILLEQHLLALDRRVKIILKTVYKCIEKNGGPEKIVLDDGF